MAENIVGSLFGISPDQLNRQNLDLERQRAVEFAQLSPFERANMGMYQAGGQLARVGAGMLGLKTGQEQMAAQQEEIQRQIDHSTPEGLMQGAQLFNQAGNPRMAFMYQQAAVAKQQELANLQRTQAQEQLALAQAQKAGREEDMTKYGRLQKVEIGVEGKPDYRQQALYDPLSGKTTTIGAPYRVTAAITAEARADAATKKDEAKVTKELPAAKMRTNIAIQNIDRLTQAINELEKDEGLANITGPVFGRTPNLTGRATGAQAKLNSIKAQTFVAALQAMREASKTGGAVGNVSNREGDKLESTLAALDQAQTTADFKIQLRKAVQQLEESKRIIQQAFEEQYGSGSTQQTVPQGMRAIGKTPDGKTVYQSPDGKKWVQ